MRAQLALRSGAPCAPALCLARTLVRLPCWLLHPCPACPSDLPSPADIDATGIHFLDDLVDELRDDNVDLVLGNPAKNVLVQLKRAHLVRKIGRANIHINVADAVNQVGGSYCNWAGQGYGCMGA